ncbi:MAG: hypothetical protein COZ34_02960 [Candidatus Pacebacteria bacterium CG_4_10_14_3_um_filter_34_15]|nr:MAG: hypothetical protein COZ34_02960 [Candidatus Pacebacteria bacterium CG_4_10_14_3_um_filter_34_15]
MKIAEAVNFAQLFKFYKASSGFKTYSQFANALAKKGIVYDLSLFSHWQRGSRVPKKRELLLILIEIFTTTGSMRYQEQANIFLKSANKKFLSNFEKEKLPLLQNIPTPISLNLEFQNFIILDEANKKLKTKTAIIKQKFYKFSFLLSSDTFQYLEKASRATNSSKANFIRKLIEDHKKFNNRFL